MGLLCIITGPIWLYLLLFPEGYDYMGGIIILLLALIVNGSLIMRASSRDPLLRNVLVAAFFVKLVGAAAYSSVVFRLYEGGADAVFYFRAGSHMAQDFMLHGDWATPAVTGGTLFLCKLVALLFVVTGPSFPGGVVIFAALSFWGQYFFYRAFCIAFPQSNQTLAALFLFFFPSIVFWPATIGKDALLMFLIGLASYSFAKIVHHSGPKSFALALLTVGAILPIRPHVAAMVALSMSSAFLLGENRSGMAGMLAKILGLPILLLGTYYVLFHAQAQLGVSTDATETATYLNSWVHNTNVGGSAANAGGLGSRLLLAPLLSFRPFPWEVNSLQTAIASVEGLFLLVSFWFLRKNFLQALRRWRSDPFIFFIVLFAAEGSLALAAAFSNFGLLARQRVMYLPLLIMLFTAHLPAPAYMDSASQNSAALPQRRSARASGWVRG